jgi:ATP-binding cassette, subfamily C, bacterial CydD
MSGTTETDRSAQRWLRKLERDARPWSGLAVAAGLVQALAMIAQSALLAWLFHELIIAARPFANVQAAFFSLPLVIALRALAGLARDEAGLRASASVRQNVRSRLLDRIHVLGPAWVSRHQGGALAAQLLEQVEALDGYFARYRPQQWLAVLVPLLILFAVFPLSWGAGLILLLSAPLIPFFMAIVGYGARARQTQQLQALGRMSGQFLDTLRGLTTLKLMDAHRRQAEVVAHTAEDFRVRTMSVLRLAFLSGTVLEFFASVAIAISAVYLGFSLLGYLDFGFYGNAPTLFIAFFVLLLAPEFYLPLRELGTHYHARAEALAAAGQLLPLAQADSPQPTGGGREVPHGAPEIALTGVSFAHVPGVPVLDELSLHIAAGEAVAIVGASGSGKTTLLRLVLGQLRPDSGSIRISDIPFDELDPAAWRERIGWMSQHPRLMAASLADNLRVARTDADEAALLEALQFAGLGEWFDQLPHGLDTKLGEGGRLMSGGQLRRLALARVRLRNASLLLLDEPTASLDRDTEALVMTRIAQLRAGRTMILLSHRSAPLQLVDRVITLPGTSLAEAHAEDIGLSPATVQSGSAA